MFELNCVLRNYLYLTDMSGKADFLLGSRHVVSFWTPSDKTFLQVADMTGKCRQHVADTTQTQPVGVWANKSTRQHST